MKTEYLQDLQMGIIALMISLVAVLIPGFAAQSTDANTTSSPDPGKSSPEYEAPIPQGSSDAQQKVYRLTVREGGVYLDDSSSPVDVQDAIEAAQQRAADHQIVVRSGDSALNALVRGLDAAGIQPKMEVSQ